MSDLSVYDPRAYAFGHSRHAPAALDALAGKTVGFIDNGKPNFNLLVDDLSELLVAHFGVAGVIKCRKRGPSVPAPERMLKQIVAECDAVITGSGD